MANPTMFMNTQRRPASTQMLGPPSQVGRMGGPGGGSAGMMQAPPLPNMGGMMGGPGGGLAQPILAQGSDLTQYGYGGPGSGTPSVYQGGGGGGLLGGPGYGVPRPPAGPVGPPGGGGGGGMGGPGGNRPFGNDFFPGGNEGMLGGPGMGTGNQRPYPGFNQGQQGGSSMPPGSPGFPVGPDGHPIRPFEPANSFPGYGGPQQPPQQPQGSVPGPGGIPTVGGHPVRPPGGQQGVGGISADQYQRHVTWQNAQPNNEGLMGGPGMGGSGVMRQNGVNPSQPNYSPQMPSMNTMGAGGMGGGGGHRNFDFNQSQWLQNTVGGHFGPNQFMGWSDPNQPMTMPLANPYQQASANSFQQYLAGAGQQQPAKLPLFRGFFDQPFDQRGSIERMANDTRMQNINFSQPGAGFDPVYRPDTTGTGKPDILAGYARSGQGQSHGAGWNQQQLGPPTQVDQTGRMGGPGAGAPGANTGAQVPAFPGAHPDTNPGLNWIRDVMAQNRQPGGAMPPRQDTQTWRFPTNTPEMKQFQVDQMKYLNLPDPQQGKRDFESLQRQRLEKLMPFMDQQNQQAAQGTLNRQSDQNAQRAGFRNVADMMGLLGGPGAGGRQVDDQGNVSQGGLDPQGNPIAAGNAGAMMDSPAFRQRFGDNGGGQGRGVPHTGIGFDDARAEEMARRGLDWFGNPLPNGVDQTGRMGGPAQTGTADQASTRGGISDPRLERPPGGPGVGFFSYPYAPGQGHGAGGFPESSQNWFQNWWLNTAFGPQPGHPINNNPNVRPQLGQGGSVSGGGSVGNVGGNQGGGGSSGRDEYQSNVNSLVGHLGKDAQRALNEYNASTAQRDDMIRRLYGQRSDNTFGFQGESAANLLDQLQNREGSAMDIANNMGASMLTNVNDLFGQRQAGLEQGLVGRGLLNTTIKDSAEAGLTREHGKAVNEALDRIAQLRLNTFLGTSGDRLSAAERLHGERTNLMRQMPKDLIDYLERIDPQPPDLAGLIDLARLAGQGIGNFGQGGGGNQLNYFIPPQAYGQQPNQPWIPPWFPQPNNNNDVNLQVPMIGGGGVTPGQQNPPRPPSYGGGGGGTQPTGGSQAPQLPPGQYGYGNNGGAYFPNNPQDPFGGSQNNWNPGGVNDPWNWIGDGTQNPTRPPTQSPPTGIPPFNPNAGYPPLESAKDGGVYDFPEYHGGMADSIYQPGFHHYGTTPDEIAALFGLPGYPKTWRPQGGPDPVYGFFPDGSPMPVPFSVAVGQNNLEGSSFPYADGYPKIDWDTSNDPWGQQGGFGVTPPASGGGGGGTAGMPAPPMPGGFTNDGSIQGAAPPQVSPQNTGQRGDPIPVGAANGQFEEGKFYRLEDGRIVIYQSGQLRHTAETVGMR